MYGVPGIPESVVSRNQASVAVDGERRHSVYYEGRLVGQWVFNPYQAKVAQIFPRLPTSGPPSMRIWVIRMASLLGVNRLVIGERPKWPLMI